MILLLVTLFVLDRLLKAFVLWYGVVYVMPFFVLSPVINDHPFLLVGMSSNIDALMVSVMPYSHAITSALLLVTAARTKNKLALRGAALMSLGLLSNGIDCLFFGGVVDPITFPVGGGWWNAVNVADGCILAGYVCFAVYIKRAASTRVWRTA
jgi:lipoprotein signal peptidase